MKKLNILPEIRDYIPPLSKDELEQLHRNIDAEGRATDPLVLWKGKDGNPDVLVDGHHRYAYCTKMGYPFTTITRSFRNINRVKGYMILNQLGKRNVTPSLASQMRADLYELRKNPEGAPKGNKYNEKRLLPQNEGVVPAKKKSNKTAVEVAKLTGVSRATVERDVKKSRDKKELSTKGIDTTGMTAKAINQKASELRGEKPKKENPLAKADKVALAFTKLNTMEEYNHAMDKIQAHYDNL